LYLLPLTGKLTVSDLKHSLEESTLVGAGYINLWQINTQRSHDNDIICAFFQIDYFQKQKESETVRNQFVSLIQPHRTEYLLVNNMFHVKQDVFSLA